MNGDIFDEFSKSSSSFDLYLYVIIFLLFILPFDRKKLQN